MQDLLPRAEAIAARLKERGETIAVAESSTGGLIAAALLSVAGASAYFIGGGVIYTLQARRALLDIQDEAMRGMRASTEAYALLLARTAQKRFGSVWALSETGATGPTGPDLAQEELVLIPDAIPGFEQNFIVRGNGVKQNGQPMNVGPASK